MSFSMDRGATPLLVSMPHVATRLPADQKPRYVERALAVEDTDWHLDRLYDFVRDREASVIVPNYSRYLIDLNRPPDNAPMYAGANNTELCPTRFFTGEPLYRAEQHRTPPRSAAAARNTGSLTTMRSPKNWRG